MGQLFLAYGTFIHRGTKNEQEFEEFYYNSRGFGEIHSTSVTVGVLDYRVGRANGFQGRCHGGDEEC